MRTVIPQPTVADATWAALDLDELSDDALDRVVHEIAEARHALDAAWLRVLGAVGRRGLHRRHGCRDVAGYLTGLTGERRGDVRRDADLAGQLADMPVVADGIASGGLSKAKAAELVRAGDLPSQVQEDLVLEAMALPVEQVVSAVRRARLAHGVAEPPVEPAATLTHSRDRVRLEAVVDLVDGEIVQVALDAAASALGLPTGTTYAERRAHALVAVCRHYLDHADALPTSRVGRPHVLLLVDLEVLEARAGGVAVLGSGAVISGDQARQLAADASITRIVTKGRSEVLDVGRSTRTAIAATEVVRHHPGRARCTTLFPGPAVARPRWPTWGSCAGTTMPTCTASGRTSWCRHPTDDGRSRLRVPWLERARMATGTRGDPTMSTPNEPEPDPIDEEAAAIDARSEEAAEEIEELREHAAEEGRDVEPEPGQAK
jgi:hypothetical protein